MHESESSAFHSISHQAGANLEVHHDVLYLKLKTCIATPFSSLLLTTVSILRTRFHLRTDS
jgi:hypothetical protein